MTEATAAPGAGWRTPMVVILAGCAIAVIGFGIRSVFGFFLDPITEAQGWSRETFSIALSVQNLVWGLAAPVAGALADRYGPARVIVLGALIFGAATWAMGVVDNSVLFTLVAGVAVGGGIGYALDRWLDTGPWLLIVFFVFYRLLKSRVIPSVAAVLADRDARIQGDLELAQSRRDELEVMRTAYEADLAKARSNAQAELGAAQARIAEKQAAALEVVAGEIAAQAATAEQRITAEKSAALADIRTVAIAVASAASSRLGGGKVDATRIEAAVDASLEVR